MTIAWISNLCGTHAVRGTITDNGACTVQVAFVGFAAAALVTRQGPIEALTSHLSDPLNNNIIGSIARLPQTLGASAPSVPTPSA